MTEAEVLEVLGRGNAALAEARRLFDQALEGAESPKSRCWASHMAALLADSPLEKLRLNEMSFDAARDASLDDEADAASLFPTVLANLGYSQLLMARPIVALQRYEEARHAVAAMPQGERALAYAASIEGMIDLISAALAEPPAAHQLGH